MPSSDDLFVYFDSAPVYGHLNGSIQIELVANALDADERGAVEVRRVTTAHLRCSPSAASDLIRSLQDALDLADKPSPQSASYGGVN